MAITVNSIYRQIWYLSPFYLGQLILICLIVYRITSNKLSIKEKEGISYAELVVSFLASFVPIVIYGQSLFFMILFLSMKNIKLIMYYVLLLLLTPFVFTILRVALENKASEEQKLILSVVTILITIFATYTTTIFYAG